MEPNAKKSNRQAASAEGSERLIGRLPAPGPHPGPEPHPNPGHAADRLAANQKLATGDQLVSPNGIVRLVMQADGNLVLYRTDSGQALWASNTWHKPVVTAIMQADGSFVCYDAANHPYWASGTNGHTGASVVLQNDGNLVVYGGDGAPLWASNTVISLPTQTRAQVVLKRLYCASTTEDGHDEVYFLFSGVDGAGKAVSHRGPDATQSGDADNQTAWDMNDSGAQQNRTLNAILCDVALATGQNATLTFGFMESDGQDWGSTVTAAAGVAGKIGSAIPLVTIAAQIVGWLGGFIPKNQDDALGAFALRLTNADGRVTGQEVVAGSYTTLVHPLDSGAGTFSVRFRHDDGDYTADFQIRGA